MTPPTEPTDYRVIAEGLQFPEGPVPLSDGSVLVVEVARGTLSRVLPDGTIEVAAECGGGPNGAAIGPDGAVYITNNGGSFEYFQLGDMTIPGGVPSTWSGGSIQRVDLSTGEVTTLYTECAGLPLRGPNDLVFDSTGGFWFTDHGVRLERSSDRTGVFYAQPDGSAIREVLFPLDAPNGIGLSPDQDRLYVAETHTGRLFAWPIPEPGVVATGTGLLAPHGDLVAGLPGMQLLDSLAVDELGNVCIGTLVNGGITVVSSDGSDVTHFPVDDLLVTNIAFGGPDLQTAFLTSSGTGRLLSARWPNRGLRPAFVL